MVSVESRKALHYITVIGQIIVKEVVLKTRRGRLH